MGLGSSRFRATNDVGGRGTLGGEVATPASQLSTITNQLSTSAAPRRLMSPRDDTRVLYLNTPGVRVGRKDEVLDGQG